MGKSERGQSQYDVAGIFQTYAYKASNARDLEHLKEIVKNIRYEFDLRRLRFETAEDDERT